MRTLPVVCFLLSCLLISCAGPSVEPSPAAVPRRIRVLTYNIHHGEGTDGRLDLERVAAVIRAAGPDLVALQEVDDRARRTGGVSQTAQLAKLTGMEGHFGQAMSFQGGGYGQAILSKTPIESTTVRILPQKPGREPRICFIAQTTAGTNGPPLVFASTHLDHEIEAIRLEQASSLESSFRTIAIPSILAGDLNATPQSGTLRILGTNWIDTAAAYPQPTIPSDRPTRRIDYILARPPGSWRVIDSRVLEEAVASDHRPVLATLEWVEP